MTETEYLFSTAKNKRRLLESIKQKNPMKQFWEAIKEIPWDNVLLFVVSFFCAIVFSFFIVILLMGLK